MSLTRPIGYQTNTNRDEGAAYVFSRSLHSLSLKSHWLLVTRPFVWIGWCVHFGFMTVMNFFTIHHLPNTGILTSEVSARRTHGGGEAGVTKETCLASAPVCRQNSKIKKKNTRLPACHCHISNLYILSWSPRFLSSEVGRVSYSKIKKLSGPEPVQVGLRSVHKS